MKFGNLTQHHALLTIIGL